MNMANETISEKCETLYNKLNAFVTSVISRDVTPKISNLNTEVWGSDTQTGNSRIDTLNTNFNNLDGSITSMESDINNVESDVSNLQTSVNSLSTSITNLATRVKGGKVTNKSVKKQSVGRYTVTHNLGRPNVPVVTLNLGNSSDYAWGNTQASVYDVTNNDFKVIIFNNTDINGNFGFNWIVVATD